MIADRPLNNVRAYELYLRAREEINHQSKESLDRALEDLERGLEIVGENALIYAAMGYAYWQYINIGVRTIDEFSVKVEVCVEKVFELEPGSAHGYMLLSKLALFKGDTKGQVEHLLKVLERDPNNSDALAWLTVAYSGYGKMEAAWRVFAMLEKNKALNWLENAVDLGFYNYIYMSEHDPFFKTLRKEKRFVELMKYAKTQCDEFEVMVFKNLPKAVEWIKSG